MGRFSTIQQTVIICGTRQHHTVLADQQILVESTITIIIDTVADIEVAGFWRQLSLVIRHTCQCANAGNTASAFGS